MTIVVLFLDMDVELRGCVAFRHIMPGQFLCRGLIKVPGIWHLNSVYFSCLFNFFSVTMWLVSKLLSLVLIGFKIT